MISLFPLSIGEQEDVLRMIKAKDKAVWETYILISCYPVLNSAPKLVSTVTIGDIIFLYEAKIFVD